MNTKMQKSPLTRIARSKLKIGSSLGLAKRIARYMSQMSTHHFHHRWKTILKRIGHVALPLESLLRLRVRYKQFCSEWFCHS